MKKIRIKRKLETLATRQDAEAAMNDLALTENNRRKLIARRDAYILEVNARYEADLSDCAETIKAKTESLQAWAEANREEFPKDRKSLKLLSGLLGFRTGNPKLALLSRAFTWESVLGLVSERLPSYVRTKPEVDKEALLAAHSKEQLTDAQLATVGTKVAHDESFYVEPDLTPFETRQTIEAK